MATKGQLESTIIATSIKMTLVGTVAISIDKGRSYTLDQIKSLVRQQASRITELVLAAHTRLYSIHASTSVSEFDVTEAANRLMQQLTKPPKPPKPIPIED
jgi:hypothetical protein